MQNIWKVDNAIIDVVAHLGYRVCIEYMYIEYTHKECNVFTMWHVLVWDQTACDNSYLTHKHHVVCCVEHITAIKETGILYNKF